MENKTTFVDVIVESVIITVSILLSFVTSLILGILVAMYSIGIPFLGYFADVLSIVICIVGVCVTLSVIAYKMGYKTVGGTIPRTLAAFGVAYVIFLIPACFYSLTSEALIRDALKSIGLLPREALTIFSKYALFIVPVGAAILLFLIFALVCTLFILFRKKGAKKRLSDRREMGIIK